MRRIVIASFVVSALATAGSARAQTCAEEPGFAALDFWVGEWDVLVDDEQVGTNQIEKVMSGCAIVEHWMGADGNPGMSLFYYTPATGIWRQVWVTPYATRSGGVKEKTMIATYEDGGVRFQGSIPLGDGKSYLDRTTLTPMADGLVRQVIAVSRDGGNQWNTGFDAIYRRAEEQP